MGWELNRSLFRRLVQLYLLLQLALALAIFAEFMDSRWYRFIAQFDLLVADEFGAPVPMLEEVGMWATVAGFLWHLASALGLLRFKRWARSGFWISILLMWVFVFLPSIMKPTYSASWTLLISAASEAVLGMIILLSYSRDHGRAWFRAPPQQLSETN